MKEPIDGSSWRRTQGGDMSFKARCVFCQHEMQAPDQALGASGRCPRCGNHFTVVPLDEPVALPATWAGKKLPARPSVGASTAADAAEADQPVPVSRPALIPPLRIADETPADPQFSWRRHLQPAGVAALLLGGLGLLFASLAGWTWLTIPLSILGVLTGLGGVMYVQVCKAPGMVLAAGGTALSVAVLLVAVLLPAMLGPVYLASRSGGESRGEIEVIPLQPGATPTMDEAGYVDAGQAALQHGRLRMQIVSVSVAAVGGAAKKSEPALVVRLRVQRIEESQTFAAKNQSYFSAAAETPRLVLRDTAGNAYRQRAVKTHVADEREPRPSPFPVAVADELVFFEPVPPAGAELRLDVPTAAWGGTAVFRFAIPGGMIGAESTRPVASGTGRGG